jgi:hypothetical protein
MHFAIWYVLSHFPVPAVKKKFTVKVKIVLTVCVADRKLFVFLTHVTQLNSVLIIQFLEQNFRATNKLFL